MSSREAFETGPGKELSLAKRDDGTYISVTTGVAWEAWQAATERAAEIAYDHLDDAFLSGHGYATGVSEAVREGNDG